MNLNRNPFWVKRPGEVPMTSSAHIKENVVTFMDLLESLLQILAPVIKFLFVSRPFIF